MASKTDGDITIRSEQAQVIGVRPWKRWQVDRFLRDRYATLHYCRTPAQALRRQRRDGGDLVVWASREPETLAAAAAAQGAALIRIEDGFLRSIGLGSNHVGGASLVVDADGIYFDPRSPSALERLLEAGSFDAAMLARAQRLAQLVVRGGLSKYNVGHRGAVALGGAGRRRLLVPGQVADDASVRRGAGGMSNLGLLQRVRASEPDAWIVYKPHPDTEAGTRRGAIPDAELLRHADQVVRGVAATALFPQVDGVHTMTSLLGFEALLRGLPVTTWGQPFYAGWGLTTDHAPLARRTRRRTLDELVAAALIVYPRYVHPDTGAPCAAEDVAEWLAARASTPAAGRPGHRLLNLCHGLLRSWASAHARS